MAVSVAGLVFWMLPGRLARRIKAAICPFDDHTEFAVSSELFILLTRWQVGGIGQIATPRLNSLLERGSQTSTFGKRSLGSFSGILQFV